MGRRGQLAIFMIVGLIVLAVLAFGIYWLSPSREGRAELSLATVQPGTEEYAIKTYVESCLKQSADSYSSEIGPLWQIGRGGGFISEKDSDRDFVEVDADPSSLIQRAAILYDGSLLNPNLESMEDEASYYLLQNFTKCFDIEKFSSQGVRIIPVGEPIVDVEINDNDVLVTLDYPMRIDQKEKVVLLSEFSAIIPLPINKAVDMTNFLLSKIDTAAASTDPFNIGSVCDEICERGGNKIHVQSMGEIDGYYGVLIRAHSEPSHNVYGRPYVFAFFSSKEVEGACTACP